MKTVIKTTSAARSLALVTSIIALFGGLSASAESGLIVNETFDPPSVDPLFGWEDTSLVVNISRQYVSEGVEGSTAAQISAEFLGDGAYIGTMLYQNGLMTGNVCATPQNTVLSFDVKVDRSDLAYIQVGIQSWGGYLWNYYPEGLPVTASIGTIPLGPYTPGEFKTVVVRVDDPLWIQDPFGVDLDGPFDPSGKTYQIFVSVDSGALPVPGEFTLTIDNIKVSTENLSERAIANLSATPNVLWAPNHKMVDVALDYSPAGSCGFDMDIVFDVAVTCNQPSNGFGDGNTSPDWEILDPNHVRLRAERAGTQGDRVYSITVTGYEWFGETGESSSKTVTVTVPKNQGNM